MKTIELSREDLDRLRGAWPDVCCGCGATATTTYGAYRRLSRYVTYRLPVPACGRCAGRAVGLPIAWGVLCALIIAVALFAITHGQLAPLDAMGNPVAPWRRALGLSLALSLMASLTAGPVLYFVIQRALAPALVVDFHGALNDVRRLALACRDDALVVALRARLRAG